MIIGLTGKAGSGKSTVASYLASEYGFYHLAFADTLKNMLDAAGIHEPSREFKETTLPGFSFSYREAAQKLGTEWGRSLDPDLWVKLLDNNVKKHYKNLNIVIADVRFENEAEYVRENGVLIHIEGRESDLGDNAEHSSEAGVSCRMKDYYLYNNKTLDELYKEVDIIMSDLIERHKVLL